MKSTCKSLEVFDFNEEDEISEMASARFMSQFNNSNALDKYKFLENVARGTNIQTKEIGDVPCVDVDAIDNDQNCDDVALCTPLEAKREDCATKGTSGLDDNVQLNSTSHEQHLLFVSNKLEPGSPVARLEARGSSPEAALPGNSQLNCALLKPPSSDESADVISDADESMNESSPSTSFDIAEDGVLLDGASSDHCFGGWEMGETNVVVGFSPDYIVYCDRYYKESEITFSSSCIIVKGSTAYGNQGTYIFQWGIDDIIDIESQWFGRFETAMVKIRVISKDEVQAENVLATSGIEELKFAVDDSEWYEKQDAIISLDVRYKALWNVVFDLDMGKDGEAIGQNGGYFPKSYFPNFDGPFEDVVYPKGDSDAVSISKSDVDLLRPETFVNDTIIDFYIKYLKNKIQPEERHRFYFFNSFFFRKLADLDKNPSSAFEGRAAFQRVRKWTRKVNLFEKDYIFIPVNFNYHWSLIVICHPGEVAEFQDEDVEKSLKVPCILHMDSIKGSHTGLKDLVQSYLWEEWKERQKETSEHISPRFFNLRFVPLELPQQKNSFDCGLFLLHYVELFLEEAPVNFSPFKIMKFSNFLNVDWFEPDEASLKRALIQRLIYELLENRSGENSLAFCSDNLCASNYPASNNENETGVEFLPQRCSPSKSCHGNLLSSRAGQGIEITLLSTSSLRSSQCATDSGLVLREFFEGGAAARSLLDGQYQTFDPAASFDEFKNAISPIEEDAEAGGPFVCPPSTEASFQRLAGITPEACTFPYSTRDFGSETSWNPGISVQQAGHEDIELSPETSISASDNSLGVEVNENIPERENLGVKEEIDQSRSLSTGNVECLTESLASEMLDVADSQSPERMLDCNGLADRLGSCPNGLPGLPHEDCDTQENGDITCDVGLTGDDSESDVLPAAKRLRLTLPLQEERKLTRSMSKDLHL
uniref:Putative ubiquitin-like-specific protease 2B isoform X2 n=1 Tax=Davidia involucrata TaxID=16924 RepID=A0A5B6Z6G2_DAVIN